MKISVIIPAYNEEKYIRTCLESLQKQEVPADEIIVVDNNSKDNTASVASSYGVRVITETKQGITPARNAGFNAASGDVLARCDADTIVPSDWIKKIKNHFEQENIGGLTGGVLYYDLDVIKHNSFFATLYSLLISLLIPKVTVLLGMNYMLTRTAWTDVKNEVCLNDKQVHEDIDLSIHLSKHGYIIKRDPTLIVKSSARRIKNRPTSFFIEYPYRVLTTVFRTHTVS